MRKLSLFLIILVTGILITACAAASLLYGLLIAIGVDDIVCSQIADVSADTNGDGYVDQDMNGDGNIDLNDQTMYEYNLKVFSTCKLILKFIGFLITTASQTIEVHNADNGQWVVLTRIPESFNLLELQGKLQSMVYKENIPPGRYDKLRIDLEKVEVISSNGKRTTAIMPSKELIIDTEIVVVGNSKSAVELKIDLVKSLYIIDDKQIIFAPVIDVKSRKNVNVNILNENKKLVSILGGSLLKSEKFGMDLDGKMKKDFVLDKTLRLSVENGKVVIKKPTLEDQPKLPVSQPLTEETNTVIAKSDQPEEIRPSSSAPVEEKIGSAIEEVTVVSVQAKKWFFQPYKILVKKGKVIQLNIIPALGLQFTFAIPEYGIEQEITGQTAIKFKADKAGTFKFLCSSCEGFRNMKGTVVVEDTATVEITASGFVPQIISITAGDTVTWANENIADAWPASAVHPTHQAYPSSGITKCGTVEQATIFDACKRVEPSESWSFVFNEVGTWDYHDHLNPGHTGTVVVQ